MLRNEYRGIKSDTGKFARSQIVTLQENLSTFGVLLYEHRLYKLMTIRFLLDHKNEDGE
jgi:hypothetical protein